MRVVILDTQDGDWVGVYVDGTLKDEGHSLRSFGALYLLNLSEQYAFQSTDIVQHELNDWDDEDTTDTGNLPTNLDELNGYNVYNNNNNNKPE